MGRTLITILAALLATPLVVALAVRALREPLVGRHSRWRGVGYGTVHEMRRHRRWRHGGRHTYPGTFAANRARRAAATCHRLRGATRRYRVANLVQQTGEYTPGEVFA